VGGAVLLFLLLHIPPFRRGTAFAFKILWRVIRFLLFDTPRTVWRHPLMQRFLASRIMRWG